MAVSEYPWALHLAVCAGYLLFVLALQLAPLGGWHAASPWTI
ncbi:MAG: hypothetical protein ACLVJH_09870 [Faecalibacterium prausnitzii]